MHMPQPSTAHEQLLRLVGEWSGAETVSPSPFDPTGGPALGTVQNRSALDGFAVIQDYVQERGRQVSFRGHGVFTHDGSQDRYRLDWTDSMGGMPATFHDRHLQARRLIARSKA